MNSGKINKGDIRGGGRMEGGTGVKLGGGAE